MLLALSAIVIGIVLLVFSADRFVEGAAVTAKYLGVPPLLIGMVVIGFGSSMPEMVIALLAALDGNPGLALGNALGSNITNIALILGITAIISPIAVGSSVIKTELPLLLGITLITVLLLYVDASLDRWDGIVLVLLFFAIMGWSIYVGMNRSRDHLADAVEQELSESLPIRTATIYLIAGLIMLVISSRILVWGGVEIAQQLGISDLIIGLTIVAIGTSLPELASSIAAVRKNEHELALGNVIGSNMFNISIVVGIAGSVAPGAIDPDVIWRDIPVLVVMTGVLFLMCFGFRGEAHINRTEGMVLLAGYLGYNGVLLLAALS